MSKCLLLSTRERALILKHRAWAADGVNFLPDTDFAPWRDHMSSEAWYQRLDPGIRFAVRLLHANGINTGQSCAGRGAPMHGDDGKGPGDEHCYDWPTVDLGSYSNDAAGFMAVAILQSYDLPVRDVSIVWDIKHGLPIGQSTWRITFWKHMEDRADQKTMFISGYRAV